MSIKVFLKRQFCIMPAAHCPDDSSGKLGKITSEMMFKHIISANC